MIEEGTYRARSCRAVLGESNTGKEQVAVEWELIDGPSPCEGQKITSYHYFSSDEATRISLEQLRTGGFRGNDITDLRSMFPDAEPPEVELVIFHDTYNGKTRPKVKFVNSLGGMAVSKPLDDARQRAFAARMKGVIAAFDAQNGKPAAPAPRTTAGNHQQRAQAAAERGMTRGRRPVAAPEPEPDFQATDDDVPF